MDVTIYDSLDPKSGANRFNIEPFKREVHLVIGDIVDYNHVMQVVEKADVIINCATNPSHVDSMREPFLNLDVNIRGVINLLEAIRHTNSMATFINVGTTTQLGPLHYRPADEYHPEYPMDIYSANKTVSEKYVLIYAKAYGLNLSAVRLPNVYGPRAALHSPEFTFNNFFIGMALQNKSIPVFKPGTQLRNVLYVDDAVEALLAATQSKQAVGESFFAVSDDHYSVQEIAEKTCAVMGGSTYLVDWPENREAIEIGDAIISNKKIRRLLAWAPQVGFEEGLKKTRKYFDGCLHEYLR